MKAYSMDLRKRVLADSDAGLPTKPVAQKHGVSRTWVRSLKQRRRETGEIAPRGGGGRKPKIDRVRLAALVQQQPDATLVELRERLGIPDPLALGVYPNPGDSRNPGLTCHAKGDAIWSRGSIRICSPVTDYCSFAASG